MTTKITITDVLSTTKEKIDEERFQKLLLNHLNDKNKFSLEKSIVEYNNHYWKFFRRIAVFESAAERWYNMIISNHYSKTTLVYPFSFDNTSTINRNYVADRIFILFIFEKV